MVINSNVNGYSQKIYNKTKIKKSKKTGALIGLYIIQIVNYRYQYSYTFFC